MATMKYFNVSSIPTAQSEEGTYYVKDETGKIATYLVSSSIVQYIGGYPELTTGSNEYIPMSQGATTTALNTLEDTIEGTIDAVREGAIGHWNIRKTYASIAEMNADKANPVDENGVLIKVGEIVTVINATTPSENGIYTYQGTNNNFKFQSSFNFQLYQTTGTDPNVAMSQKIVTENFNKLWTVLNALTIPNYYLSPDSGSAATSDETFTYSFKISEFMNLSMFDKFIISEVLQRTDLAYMAVYNKVKACLHTYVYTSGMTVENLAVNVSDILASYPTAVYIRFCSNDTTAIVTSYCNQAYLFTNRITAIELQQSTYPFVFNLKPDNIQKYWSAGGVLSYNDKYVSKSIDVTRFAGKRLRLRLGYASEQSSYVSYCYVKKVDNSYVTLNSIVKSYDSVSKIVDVILPSDAVSLDISIDILTLDLQPFVCYDSIYNQLNDSNYLKQSDYYMSFSGMKYSLLKKENGYISYSDGKKPNTTDVDWMGNTGYIGVTEGTVITYRLNAPTNVAALAAYDSNKNYLSANTIPGNGIISGTYTVPAGVAFVRVTSAGGSDQTNVVLNFDRPVLIEGLSSLYTMNAILSDNLNRITTIEDSSFAYALNENILKDVTVNYGYQNPNDGGIYGLGTDTTWFNTDFIKVKPNSDIIVTALVDGQGTDVMTIGFFDSSYICLKDISIAEYISGTRTIPVSDSRIKYVRFSGGWPNYANGTAIVKMYTPVLIQTIADMTFENTLAIESNTERITTIEEEFKNVPIGYRYDINHFIHYGQSLSQGDWQNTVVSTSQKFNSLMFQGTMRVWEYRDQANKYASLVPAVENVFAYLLGETVIGATSRGETPCVGTGEKFMEEVQADGFDFNTYQFQVLLSAPGMGGTAIEELGKGSAYYQRLLDDVTNGKRLANAAGKTYACHAVSWILGEANCAAGTSYESYYNQMNLLFSNLNTDIKAITGLTEEVHFYLYQTWCFDWYYQGFHYPYVSLAQLQISLDKPNVHMVGPIYHLPQLGDYTHFNSEGSKWFGGYCGLVYKKVMIDNEDWKPIHLTSYSVAGNCIYLRFYAPKYPLVFDTINAKDRGLSKGFQIRNANDFTQNSHLDIITNVEIARPDTIKITCSESPVGKKLTYAINGTGQTDMSSGNLRDSATDVFNFKLTEGGQDVEHKLYNWCPLFEQVL